MRAEPISTSTSPDLSVVVPVYRNADTLEELSRRLEQALEATVENSELLLVVDGCPRSLEAAERLSRERWISCLALPTNGGQQQAIRHGLERATGSAVAVMDADLQDPPEALPALYRALRERRAEAVFAARVGVYQSTGRMLSSRLFKWALRRATGLPRGSGCFVVFSRRMREAVLRCRAENFFLPGAIARTGLGVTSIPVPRNHRPRGRSAYSMGKRIRTAASHFKYLFEQDDHAPGV